MGLSFLPKTELAEVRSLIGPEVVIMCLNMSDQVPPVHCGVVLYPIQGSSCQGHPQGLGGDVQGGPAPHPRPVLALLSLPGALLQTFAAPH